MAMYTAATMLTAVRNALREPNQLFWLDTDIQESLDRGARLLSGITLCTPIMETVSPTVTGDVIYCALTAKFIHIESVVFNAVKGLQRLDPIKWGNALAGGVAGDTNRNPSSYWHFGDYLYLWPPPKGTGAASSIITVYGYRTAWAFGHDTGPVQYDIPDALHPLLLDYILAECWTKAGKHSKSRLHMQRFIADAGFHRRDVRDREIMTDSKDKLAIPDQTVQTGS